MQASLALGLLGCHSPAAPLLRKKSHPASSLAALGDNPGTEFPAEVLPGEDEACGGVTLEHRLQETHPGAGRGGREGICWPKAGVLL